MADRRVGHYLILEKIGAGGMGEVFRARDERLGRDVAIKLIHPASGENSDHLRRFEHEARAAAALNHPNILAIYDVGFEGEVPYIVTELLQGKNLRSRLSAGPVPVAEACDYALQIAQGLVAAHERRIVHRDLKPENLFLTNEGRVKILDFGVAKLQAPGGDSRSVESLTTVTKSGSVLGTVAYMSPEQLRAKPVDHRSDIFSFGAVLYEMLSGSRAFRGETEVDTMTAVLREEPKEADLDKSSIARGYRDVIRHCLEKEPENRFQSAKDLVFTLRTLAGDSGVTPVFPRPRRKSAITLPWVLAGILAAVAAILTARQLQSPPGEPVYHRLTYEAGTIYSARFAPDGQSIIYGAAWNGRPVHLFTTVGSSLLSQPLAFDDANILAISRSNELAVVLHGHHNGQLETENGMLASAPLAGGSPREVLGDARWADFDAVGGMAVVHRVEGHTRLEYPIGNVLYETSGWISHIRFSPQGNGIAFLDHPALWDDRGTVTLVDLSGHARTLTPVWECADGMAWRPDGTEIWFSAAEQGNDSKLMAVTLKGASRTLLTLPGGLTLKDVAPDGRVLASLDSKRLAMGSAVLGGKEDVDVSWHDWSIAKDISRDGQFVLFEDASDTAGADYEVGIRRLDGSLPTRLGAGSAGTLSPDGKWAISILPKGPDSVTLLPIGAGQPRQLHINGLERVQNAWARFLPDGKSILVNGNEAGKATRCYMVDLSAARPRALTPEGTRCGPISPDGESVAAGFPNGPAKIYPTARGTERTLSSIEPGFTAVQWSEDGSALYGYHEGELPSRIYRADIATGKQAVVQELHPGSPAGVVNVAPVVVSRDGRRFAYSYNQTLSVLYLISGVH
jgi:serine/threonine protein kinase